MTQQADTELEDLMASVAEDHGLDEVAFILWCKNFYITSNFDEQVTDFTDAYIGEMSVLEYAEELADDIYADAVKTGYFDYESFARDLEIGGDVWASDGYLFRNC